MAGSAKPGRRRAAAPALHYQRQPGRPRSSSRPKKKGEFVFGCLIFLGVSGVIVLLATLDWFWGDDTWQWAAEAWPGGAYGFAVGLGVAGPCLAALSVFCLLRTGRKYWRALPAVTLARTGLGVLATAALVPWAVLVFNAQNDGRRRSGRSSPPSWVFAHYPWLWAVGLFATLTTITALIWATVLYCRRRRSDPTGSTEVDNTHAANRT